jgi:MFS family permease
LSSTAAEVALEALAAESRTIPPPVRTISALAIGILPVALAQSMLVPAIPEMARELNVSTAEAGWAIAAFFVVASAAPIFGRLGDMFGKRRMAVISAACFGLGAAVSAATTNYWVVVGGRFLQGIGACLVPLCFSLARDLLPTNLRARSISVLSALTGAGSGVGLVIGGLISDQLSYRWIFWVTAILGVAMVGGLRFLLPESPIQSGGRVDVRGAVFLAVGIGLPMFGISRAADWGWADPRTLVLIASGVSVLASWVWLEKRTAVPLIDIGLLRRPPVLTTNLATILLGFGTFSSFVLGAELAQSPRTSGYGFGLSATMAGLLLLPGALAVVVFAPLSAVWGARVGNAIPLAVGAVIAGFSLLSLAFAHGTELELCLLVAVAFVGVGLAYAALVNLILDLVPAHRTGEAVGVNSVMLRTGVALGTQVSATVLAASTLAGSNVPLDVGYRNAFVVSAVLAFASAISALFARHGRDVTPLPIRTVE